MKRLALIILLMVSVRALALGPDNLLLLVNRNVPQGRELAEHYAKVRGVPEGRIVDLDLPTGDEISFDDFESKVVPVVREFVTRNKLESRIRCLVTFYGVPLRIAARTESPAEQLEAAELKQALADQYSQLLPKVEGLEKLAKRVQPGFISFNRGKSIEALSGRGDVAARLIASHIGGMDHPPARDALVKELTVLVDGLVGPGGIAQRHVRELEEIPNLTEAQRAQLEKLRAYFAEIQRESEALQKKRNDPEARAKLRTLYKEKLGPIDYGRLLEGMVESFNTANSDAALDSELACVAWVFYSRSNSLPNPQHYRIAGAGMSPALMTMRLDGPNANAVRTLIDDSVQVEAKGLSGTVVIDSGGHLALDPKNPAYGKYDQTLRNLAQLIREKTKLELVFDEKREVLPAGSAKNVAIYTGWYSVRKYVPSCTFVPGAVAWHTASYEMCSLHNEGETGWCRGLLVDGVAATLGPVNEPFLHAFPPPDEFFPLLLTGKLTLAEVYWKTCPQVSWRMAIVGDPLYNPFGAHPALAVEDLPPHLAGIFKPAARPATGPATAPVR